MRDLKNVTFETNTTQSSETISKNISSPKTDLKLLGVALQTFLLGEIWDDAINPDIARSYFDVSGSSMYSSLWSSIPWTWTKLPEQYRNISEQESMFPYIWPPRQI